MDDTVNARILQLSKEGLSTYKIWTALVAEGIMMTAKEIATVVAGKSGKIRKGFYELRDTIVLDHGGKKIPLGAGDTLVTDGNILGRLSNNRTTHTQEWIDLKVKVTPELGRQLLPYLRLIAYDDTHMDPRDEPNLNQLGLWLHMQELDRTSKAPNKTWEPTSDHYSRSAHNVAQRFSSKS